MRIAVAASLVAAALVGGGAARAQEAPAGPTAVAPLTVQASRLYGLIGNTIVDTAPGETAWIQLHRDGSYDSYFNGGWAGHGFWTYGEDRLCYRPAEGPGFCAREPMAGKTVGDRWVTTGPDGKTYQATVVKGQLGG